MITDAQIKAAAEAVKKLRAAEVDGCFGPSDWDDPDDCANGTCYCARQCEAEARAALEAGEAAAWQPVELAPKDDTFLGYHKAQDAYSGDWCSLCWRSGDDAMPWEDDEGKHPPGFLTHFCVLPTPPTEGDR